MTAAAPQEIEDIPRELMRSPLDWFFAEHYRHRQFCRLLSDAAEAHVFDGPRLERLLGFMRRDLALHIVDEEEDLFPLLRRRALAEDNIDTVLGQLAAEHRADADQARMVQAHLEACLESRSAPGLDPEARKAMQNLAKHEFRHLALENAVVLPIARLRLTEDDLAAMGRRLAARRGIVLDARP